MSNRDIFLWLIGSLIAVAVMIWTAIYVMDHYLFAESHSFQRAGVQDRGDFVPIERCDERSIHHAGTKLLRAAFPQGA